MNLPFPLGQFRHVAVGFAALVFTVAATLVTLAVTGNQDPLPPPDLSETLKFLKARLEAHLTYTTTKGQFNMSSGREFQAEDFTSCDVGWKNMTVLNIGRHQEIIDAVKVNLGHVDPSFELVPVKAGNHDFIELRMRARPGTTGFVVRPMNETGRTTGEVTKEMNYTLRFQKSDEAVVHRIQKALVRAVELCGNQKEPF